MKMHRSKKGFTLVEIMIVVVIIGLLAALAIPAFNKVRSTSQDKHVANSLRQIAGAADQYFMESGLSTVAISALYNNGGTTGYIAGYYTSNVGGAANPTVTVTPDPITTSVTRITGSAIAGTTRSVVHDK